MKTKLISNDGKQATVCLVLEDGSQGPQLTLALENSSKGKTPFTYWGFTYGTQAVNDLQDYVDWICQLKNNGSIDCEADEFIRDAIAYRLNNGAFKTAQKTSKDGERLDNLGVEAKLDNVTNALAGKECFKIRTPGESQSTLKTKLKETEERQARMDEIFKERRKLEIASRKAKGKAQDEIYAKMDALDAEHDKLNA